MPRKDSKGRNLRSGESQRKDGRYVYKFLDQRKQTHSVYSWRLLKSDPTPIGQKDEKSLREKEEEVKQQAEKGIQTYCCKVTVCELVERYIEQKQGMRENTRINYRYVVNILKKDPFGARRITDIRLSDAKRWFAKLQRMGRSYNTIHAIRGIVRPAFQMAVDDDMILKNPFAFTMSAVVVNDSVARIALTEKQEKAFLDFVRSSPYYAKYANAMYVLFHTGLRISEFAGLTIDDIDLKKNLLRVDKQLLRGRDMKCYISKPKTNSGVRMLPFGPDVKRCLQEMILARKIPVKEPVVDGVSGFLCLDIYGRPAVALHWEHVFKRVWQRYNETHEEKLPLVTPHVCRHTYCTNMARKGINPKMLQYMMGHSEVGVTLDTYTHIDLQDVCEEFARIEKRKLQ